MFYYPEFLVMAIISRKSNISSLINASLSFDILVLLLRTIIIINNTIKCGTEITLTQGSLMPDL